MPPPRQQQQRIELFKQQLGPALIQHDTLAIGAPDLPLDGILMKMRVQLINLAMQIQPVEVMLGMRRQIARAFRRNGDYVSGDIVVPAVVGAHEPAAFTSALG